MLMKRFLVCTLFLLISATLAHSFGGTSQQKTVEVNKQPLLTRTTVRHERRRFPYGSTLTLVGAPAGSITIEASPGQEIDITAEIQLQAPTEQDLDRLALVNTLVLDEDADHIRLLTTGTHDKSFMKQVKKFPKTLIGLPWKIDFRIRVPVATDLDISSGRGPITINGVEGNIQLSAVDSETQLHLSGGELVATIATGKLSLDIPVKSWARGGVIVRMAAGEVNVELPSGFAGDFQAEVLRTGQIVDTYGGLEARERTTNTPQRMRARAGAGGAQFQVTVGDGTINFKKHSEK